MGISEDLEILVEVEGYKLGTPEFAAVLRARKVAACMEIQGVPNCSECPAFMGCELAATHLRELRYGVERGPAGPESTGSDSGNHSGPR